MSKFSTLCTEIAEIYKLLHENFLLFVLDSDLCAGS